MRHPTPTERKQIERAKLVASLEQNRFELELWGLKQACDAPPWASLSANGTWVDQTNNELKMDEEKKKARKPRKRPAKAAPEKDAEPKRRKRAAKIMAEGDDWKPKPNLVKSSNGATSPLGF